MSIKDVHDAEQDAAAEAWHRKAVYQNFRCSIDGEFISYNDREDYFSTKMCSYHAHYVQKDD